MASYKVQWKASAKKELRRLPKEVIPRIITAVEQLTSEPTPPGCRKLVGSSHTYRLRVGDYRILYSIQQLKLVIEIIRVAHRKDAYRTN